MIQLCINASPSLIIAWVVNGDIKDWQTWVRNFMLYFQCKSHISRWVLAAHKNNQCSGNSPSVLKDCFRNVDYFHFTTSGTSFLRQINIPRPMISRGPFTTPTTTPNHYYLPSKSFLPFCNCLCIWNIEGIGIGLSLNKNSGCFKILKTTVLLFRTVNPLVIQLHRHINFANEQMAKTRERCMHRPGKRDF